MTPRPVNRTPAPTPLKRVPRKIPDYQPFPVDARPSAMRNLVERIGKAINFDPAFAAAPAQTLTAAPIRGSLLVNPNSGFREPTTLFALTVGDSGTAKSSGSDPYD